MLWRITNSDPPQATSIFFLEHGVNHAMCESCNCSIPGQGAWELRVVSVFYSALVVLRLYNILEKENFPQLKNCKNQQ